MVTPSRDEQQSTTRLECAKTVNDERGSLTCHNRNEPSAPPEATTSSSTKVQHIARPSCPRNVRIGVPAFASHTRTDPSPAAETTRSPLCEKSQSSTRSVWPY